MIHIIIDMRRNILTALITGGLLQSVTLLIISVNPFYVPFLVGLVVTVTLRI